MAPGKAKKESVKVKEKKSVAKSFRAARRDKQRAENPERAQAMHDARIEQIYDKLFDLPPAEAKSKKQVYHIGCSGWYYRHWYERFYPKEIKGSCWFDFYKQNFDTVELNSPFYSWTKPETVRSWRRQAGDGDFVYTVKVCELITHVKKFVRVKSLVKDFGLIADMLGRHMGCFLFQMPPSYHYSPARLKMSLAQLDPTRRNVVEFRHASWWNDTVYTAFRKSGVIFCSCSAPKLPDELIKTTDDIYIRFHGKEKWYGHDYSDAELALWAKRIRDSKAQRVWVYFNNDFESFAVKNAHRLEQILKS